MEPSGSREKNLTKLWPLQPHNCALKRSLQRNMFPVMNFQFLIEIKRMTSKETGYSEIENELDLEAHLAKIV